MKRALSLTLAIIMALSMVGCGEKETKKVESDSHFGYKLEYVKANFKSLGFEIFAEDDEHIAYKNSDGNIISFDVYNNDEQYINRITITAKRKSAASGYLKEINGIMHLYSDEDGEQINSMFGIDVTVKGINLNGTHYGFSAPEDGLDAYCLEIIRDGEKHEETEVLKEDSSSSSPILSDIDAAVAEAQKVIDNSNAPEIVKHILEIMVSGITGEPKLTVVAEDIKGSDGNFYYSYDLDGHSSDGLINIVIVLNENEDVYGAIASNENDQAPVMSAFNLAIALGLDDNFSTVVAANETKSTDSYYGYLEDGYVCLLVYNEDDACWSASFFVDDDSDSQDTSSDSSSPATTSYGEGMYKVGTDLPSGTYYIKCTSSIGAYWAISSDSSGSFDSLIANENVSNFGYLTVEDGQYLEITRGQIIPEEEAPVPQPDADGYYEGGQYLVGRDIIAGEYSAVVTNDIGGYYDITSDANGRDIIANDNFDNNAYITVSDGQYLQVTRAKIKPVS